MAGLLLDACNVTHPGPGVATYAATVVPAASIVIPAHNESVLIGRCLSRLLDGTAASEWEIIVVCNGCTDDTADRARAFQGVTVVETGTPGKMPALDIGDATATVFPRVYIDADAIVELPALRALVRALDDQDVPLVGSPALHVDTSASSRLVKIYFDVWTRLRYAQEAIGSGVYALTRQARGRFEQFPQRGGDDQLVYRLYSASERIVTQPSFTYVAPRTLRSLMRSRARMFALNIELERTIDLPAPEGVGWKEQGLERVLRSSPRMIPRVALFVAVQIIIRLWGRRLSNAESIPWNQDRTSREA